MSQYVPRRSYGPTAQSIVTYTWMQIGSAFFPVMKNNFISLFINKVLGNITPSSFFYGPILTCDFALKFFYNILTIIF